MEEKQMVRRKSEKMIMGVCAGLARYFGMEPNIMRIIFVVGGLFTAGTTFWVYIVLIFIMKEQD
jgi:phage shock protein C